MTAPLMVWSPPLADQRYMGVVAIAPLTGDARLRGVLEKAVVNAKPSEGPSIIDPSRLSHPEGVQLVSGASATVPSDVASLSAARRIKAQKMLLGEILSKSEPPSEKVPMPVIADGKMTVAWRLIDVATGVTETQHTVSIDSATAIKKYPDLAAFQTSEVDVLSAAAARETWHVITPYLETNQATLALPWVSAGAEQIRRGNGYARAMRWQEAQGEWEAVLAKYPDSHVALHNLAIADVARQDFDAARTHILKAMELNRSSFYENTYGWIEQRRRAYHSAFNLPAPRDGWPLCEK